MYLYHTIFKNEIVAEFLPPKNMTSRKVIILCDGLPSLPSKNKLVRFLAKHNYWVFHMRYRGAWESKGNFLQYSPVQDVLDIVEELPKGFVDIWNQQEFIVNPEEIFVMGASFGGTTALMSSLDARIKKVIAICPVVDFKDESEEEPNDYMKELIRKGYGGVYHFSDENWDKLINTDFFNPVDHTEKFDSSKILSIHAKDDKIVMYKGVTKFMDDIGANMITREKGGHLSSSIIMNFWIFRKIKKFLAN
jgi:esterase/lipase